MSGAVMGRRGVLRLFGGAAVMGRGAAKAAAESIMGQSATLGMDAVGRDFPSPCDPVEVSDRSPLDKALHNLANEIGKVAEKDRDARRTAARGELPPSIGGKQSWSPAFKQHVYLQHRITEEDRWSLRDRIGEMTEFEKLALAAKLGLKL